MLKGYPEQAQFHCILLYSIITHYLHAGVITFPVNQ